MLIVTLAGGIGSGKSTVAAALAECGARLLSLDDVARDVLSPGEEAVREVGDLWPEAVREGKIDRSALARIVFDDAEALARAFFPEQDVEILLVINVGRPTDDAFQKRNPRLTFEEAYRVE